jgi:hypothetical protein
MILSTIQKQLEQLYQLNLHINVEDFLIDREMLCTIYPHFKTQALPQELLLVNSQEETHDIGLFVEPSVLENLKADDPQRTLDQNNLEDFLTAVEGVSHFVYLAQHVLTDHPVTELELEIQAEVDKYLLCLLYETPSAPLAPRKILRGLFHSYRLMSSLTDEQKERYHMAHRVAYRFCQALGRHCQSLSHLSQRLHGLRAFFHATLGEKLHAIATC